MLAPLFLFPDNDDCRSCLEEKWRKSALAKIVDLNSPGITKSDLSVINKTDLAPHVGADLAVMESDTRRVRPQRPYVMTNLRTGDELDRVVEFIESEGLLV